MLERTETLLERFEANADAGSRPDSVTYNTLFQNLFARMQARKDVAVRERIADQMERFLRRWKKRSHHFRTVARSNMYRYYNDCLRAWGYSGAPNSKDRALALLQEMEEASRSFPSASPNAHTYQSVLANVCQNADTEAVQMARDLFRRMEEMGVARTIASLNFFLGLLFRYRFEGSAEEGDEMFVSAMMERFEVRNDTDAFTYGWVFEGIFKQLAADTDTFKKEVCARRTERLFRTLLRDSEHFRSTEGPRLHKYYNECLRAWAFAHSNKSMEHTVRLLEEMEEKHREQLSGSRQDSTTNFQPDTKSYEYVLTCLTRAPDRFAVEKARILFRRMDEFNVPISLSLLNTFIRVLAKSNFYGALQEADQILTSVENKFLAGKDSICPNRSSYEILLQGYMRSPRGLKDADRLLDRMKNLSEKTGDKELLPSNEMYKAMMTAWTNSHEIDSIERVEETFQKLAEQSKPNSDAYRALQEAWGDSRRADAAQHVESILVKMQQEYDQGENLRAKPTIDNFNIVIKTWATCSAQEGSAERADAILKRLEDIFSSDRESYRELRPTVVSYENALLGWSLSESPDAGERAMALLDRMNQSRTDPGSPMPNTECYKCVIEAVGKSSMANKADKCYAILEEMRREVALGKNLYAQPTHDAYQAIIRICATCTAAEEERNAAFRVLTKTMREYLAYAESDARIDAFLHYLYALFRLLPAGEIRDQAATAIFTDSHVQRPNPYLTNATILDALRKTVSFDTFKHILETSR